MDNESGEDVAFEQPTCSRKARMGPKQHTLLIEFMEKHPAFAKNELSGPQAKEMQARLRKRLANQLNACGDGPPKDPSKWLKTWQDYRARVKSKAKLIANHQRATGGEFTATNLRFTPLESRCFKMMGGATKIRVKTKAQINTREWPRIEPSVIDALSEPDLAEDIISLGDIAPDKVSTKAPVIMLERPTTSLSSLVPHSTTAVKRINPDVVEQAAHLTSFYTRVQIPNITCDITRGMASDKATLETAPRTLLDADTEYLLPLAQRVEVNHDTRLFRFALPTPAHVLGVPVGQHVFLTAQVRGQRVCRKYTPTSSDDTPGHMELLVKVYFAGRHPQHPAGGVLTQHLEAMREGDLISVRGPVGRLAYLAPGEMRVRRVKKDPSSEETMRATEINMIAGGSGIAPMLQLIRHVTSHHAQDDTRIALLFANQSERDIVMRAELDACAARRPTQFRVWYTVDRAPDDAWPYSVGYVNADMVQQHLFPPSPDTVTLVCGNKPMTKQTCLPLLEQLGYQEDRRFKF